MAFKLTLDDLNPREAELILPSGAPGKTFRLKKFSLRARLWAERTHGKEFHVELSKKNFGVIASLAYFLLVEKEHFKTEDEFFEAICSPIDQLNLIYAVTETLGVDKRLMEELTASVEENPPMPQGEADPTGASTSI